MENYRTVAEATVQVVQNFYGLPLIPAVGLLVAWLPKNWTRS